MFFKKSRERKVKNVEIDFLQIDQRPLLVHLLCFGKSIKIFQVINRNQHPSSASQLSAQDDEEDEDEDEEGEIFLCMKVKVV